MALRAIYRRHIVAAPLQVTKQEVAADGHCAPGTVGVHLFTTRVVSSRGIRCHCCCVALSCNRVSARARVSGVARGVCIRIVDT